MRHSLLQLPQKTDCKGKKKEVLLKRGTFLYLVVKYPPYWGLVQRQHATLWTWKLGFESLIPSSLNKQPADMVGCFLIPAKSS